MLHAVAKGREIPENAGADYHLSYLFFLLLWALSSCEKTDKEREKANFMLNILNLLSFSCYSVAPLPQFYYFCKKYC